MPSHTGAHIISCSDFPCQFAALPGGFSVFIAGCKKSCNLSITAHFWRRVRDLNPRDAHHAYTISNNSQKNLRTFIRRYTGVFAVIPWRFCNIFKQCFSYPHKSWAIFGPFFRLLLHRLGQLADQLLTVLVPQQILDGLFFQAGNLLHSVDSSLNVRRTVRNERAALRCGDTR